MNMPTLLAASLGFMTALVAQEPQPLPILADATRIFDTAAETTRSWDQLLDHLAELDVVFLGETHVDDTTHRVELAVLEGLLQRRDGKVVLSLEMFERDSQPVLDSYLAGEIGEAEFVARSNAWENYRTGYRALIEAAKAAGIPVVAANFPRSLRRALAGGGKQAIDRLTPEQRALMPAEIFPASADYWERVDRAIRGHMGFSAGGTPEQRQYETQNLWDNSMGHNVAVAQAAHRDSVVLHVAGGFHVAYRDGTVAQFVRRSPDSRFAVVQVSPASGLELAQPQRDRDEADFLIYARQVARGFHDDTFAVTVGAEIRYRLDAPQGDVAVPLLLWLPDGRTRPEDAMAFWQAAVGGEAAIAVVEHPFPELQDDLALGGRYAFGDGFRADYGRIQNGLVRIAEYVARHYPIDRERILVAGIGDGAAVVLWSALYGQWLAQDHVAIDPKDLRRLAMEALPDRRPATRSLQFVASEVPLLELAKVAADYGKVGVETGMTHVEPGLGSVCAIVRDKLGLPPERASQDEATELLVLPSELPRAREWAEVYRQRLLRTGTIARIVTADSVPEGVDAAHRRLLTIGAGGTFELTSFASGRGLPLPGGAFGGTTVVVLPDGTAEAEREVWRELERKNVLKRRSMFANLAVAEGTADRCLPQVVAALKAKGRSRVLIVPAVFCADAATMRALQAQLGPVAQGMDVHWLPGLGGELVRGGH
ncbi:MAG: ChaN family lipoprotein [Planctomycetes bacterium]|nr:ChaN family lipoprotein [Planctomycetota bacterium]